MFATLWKEFREHGTVWLVMAGSAALALAVTPLWDPFMPAASLLGPLLALVVSWVYGVVCGAMLLAEVREDGVLSRIALPGLRRRLWVWRCLTGVGLVLTQALSVEVVAAVLNALLVLVRILVPTAGLHLPSGGWETVPGIPGLAVAGLMGLGWGLLFSADGSGVRSAVRLAPGPQVLTSVGLLLLVFFLYAADGPWVLTHPHSGLLVLESGGAVQAVLTGVSSNRIFNWA
jgi:hypothetical protein